MTPDIDTARAQVQEAADALRERIGKAARVGIILGTGLGKLADEIERFVAEQSAAARPGERFVGSTEALESCFGKLKELERQQAQSGFTGMVLSLGALLGKWTEETVRTALERTPWKAVTAWCAKHLGESLQAKRNKAFAAPQPETKPG